MEPAHTDPEIFSHIRVVMGMIVSLSLARLLSGIALFVQHPGKTRVYWIHLGWVLFMFVFLVHFWWWEFHLHSLAVIDVSVYLFVVLYCCVFFFLCVMLFPTTLDDYSDYEHYFMSRRAWFFGALALAFAVDLVDTALKGKAYFASYGFEYPARNAAYILLCIAAAWTPSRRFHAVFVVAAVAYQLVWMYRAFDLLD
ncbi:hypothetical protein ACI2KT_09420 [Ensifer adhaerens]|jgi:hypothetical protein|uniref:Transmembrane protein n=1 Tax=Ensifer adhaerens TaxID=106592 RepID=I0FX91_ENSAD|nr:MULTISPECIES: hypothetical protein [Ensifer]KSV79773.1 membrane protein [Sinorhizobium sp. GW3]MBD9495306.1 hypothetical protein [Ensifer sp. ENS01]MBD9518957.1 hypothetical protein [Ensifer sp. ENS02]MBD9568687.1 hypothetical protein [Ensifer sp. ENS08]MBD9623301.1 hypothetical protein [Ensifer sp. ENS06]